MFIQTYKEPSRWKPGSSLIPYEIFEHEEVHKRGLLHLSTHLLILDYSGNLCVRRRGNNEIRYKSLLTTTMGKHVPLDENYEFVLKEFLPVQLDLKWVGEFRVKDQYENEVNELYLAVSTQDKLGDEFMNGRLFLSIDDIFIKISIGETTPHLKKAMKIIRK